MKKTVLLISLVLLLLTSYGQDLANNQGSAPNSEQISIPDLNHKINPNTFTQTKSLAHLPVAYTERTPGDELIKMTNHYYGGVALSIAGALISTIASSQDSYEGVIAGGVISFGGLILTLESISHLRKAGRLMNKKQRELERQQKEQLSMLKLQGTNHGLGLVYNF
ncbi:MAG: hypothetical protein JEZ03_02765 [Bacteroidales bacterium]|nr:hypothetical protein [Bacteroidales bacterium]